MNAPTPTVIYTDAASAPVVGQCARVQVLNHPRFLPGEWVRTGKVTFVTGERFLTEQTMYVPGIRDNDNPFLSQGKAMIPANRK